jgi:hypothetical protein
LSQFVHFLFTELWLWIFNTVEAIEKNLCVLLLISYQAAVGGIPDSDIELQGIFPIQVTVGQLRNGDELVVPPALSDIEFGGVLANG